MVDLGTLGGSNSSATSISRSGLIVGSSQTATGESHAVLWRPATAPPVAQASLIRGPRVLPDASVDSVGASQPMTAMLTWSASLSNSGSNVVPAPTISVDTSSWAFVPPVTFPLSATGPDLQQCGTLVVHDLSGLGPLACRRQRLVDRVRRLTDDVTGDDPARRWDADCDRHCDPS